jgi:hypothetical protein
MSSPRSAREDQIKTNGADNVESMSSIEPDGAICCASCRMTCMRRFETFRVEGGKIKAPRNVMRFDGSLFRILGDILLALPAEREMVIDNATYGRRIRPASGCLLPL